MTKLERNVRDHFTKWFYKIEEPRVQRLLYFVFYLLIAWAGLQALLSSPDKFRDVGGPMLIITLGLSFVFGGTLGAVAILPGTWYLERVALVSIGFGSLYRGILILSLGISSTGAFLYYATVVLLLIRFLQIKRADLAPIKE